MKSYSVLAVYAGSNAKVAEAYGGKPFVCGHVQAKTEREALRLARKIWGSGVTVSAD